MTNFKRKPKTPQNNAGIPKRLVRFYSFFIMFMLLVLGVFLFRWQIVDHQRFVAQAGTRLQTKNLQGVRGDILAADGSVLAYSEPRFNIYVYMDASQGLVAAENAGRQTREEFVEKVSVALAIEEEDLQGKTKRRFTLDKYCERYSKRSKRQTFGFKDRC